MKSWRRTLVASAVILSSLAPAAAAEQVGRLPWALTAEGGIVLPDDHLHETGLVGLAPPAYAALRLARDLRGPWGVAVTAGIGVTVGLMFDVAATYTLALGDDLGLSFGVGPMLVAETEFGRGIFAQGEVALEGRLTPALVLRIGADAAFALNSAGAAQCGADTCEAYLARGDRVLTLRAGLGFAF